MKRFSIAFFKNRYVPITIVAVFLFLVSGCKNFFNGNGFLENLEEQIDYATAPEYSLSVVSTNADWGTITTGAGDHKKKVTDSLNLNFSLNDGYKFLKWKAISNADHSVSMADYISFTDATQTATKAKLIQGSNDILITPSCAQLFAVTGDFTDDGAGTYNRDSAITVTFNQNLAAPADEINNVENISITISGLTEAEKYFNSPVINGNKIFISCKDDVLIPVAENTTRTVTVTIPADFCYYADGEKMELGQKYVLSYTIDSTTTEKTSIKFVKDDSDSNAVFTADGVTANGSSTKYSIGQTVKLSYKNTEDYIFECFTASEGDVVLFDELDFDSSRNIYTTTITVIAGDKDITISPVITKRGTIKVIFAALKGKILSPKDDYKVLYKGASFDINFEEDEGYCFTGWQVLDSQNKAVTNYEDYLDIDLSLVEQTVTVKKVDTVLTIKAIAEERPVITGFMPEDRKTDVVRNVTIKIMFSQPMDVTMFNAENIKVTQGFLRDKGDSIVNDFTEVTNLTYQHNSTKDMLTITLPEGTYFNANSNVKIHVSKKLCSLGKNIPLLNDLEFQFQVGTETDGLAPKIENLLVYSKEYNKFYETTDFGTNGSFERDKVNTVAKINDAYKIRNADSQENVLKNLITTDQLDVYIRASDYNGAGTSVSDVLNEDNVSQIGYRITQIIDLKDGAYDNELANPFIYEGTVDYEFDSSSQDTETNFHDKTVTGGKVFSIKLDDLKGNGDTSAVNKAPDGILRIDIYAIDKRGNSGYWEDMWYKYKNGYQTFFVLKDSTAPVISNANINKVYSNKSFSTGNDIGYIGQNCYLKFKLTETGSGISKMDINLKKAGTEISREATLSLKYSSTDNFNAAETIASTTGTEITFSNSDQNKLPGLHSGWYYITNIVNFTDASDHVLSIKVTDNLGYTTELTANTKIDCTAPVWKEGPVVQQYSYSNDTTENDKINSIKIYPRVGNPGITGASFKEKPTIRNGDGQDVRWFYTNACNSQNQYGINLKSSFTDAGSPTTVKLKTDSGTLSNTKLAEITKGKIINSTNSLPVVNNSVENYFTTGTYSIVAYDEAGNTSKALTFVVVKDDVRPLRHTNVTYTSDDWNVSGKDDLWSNSEGVTYRDIRYLMSFETDAYLEYYSIYATEDYDNYYYNVNDTKPFFNWLGKESDSKFSEDFTKNNLFAGNRKIYGTAAQIKDTKYVVYLNGIHDRPKKIYDRDKIRFIDGEYWSDAWPSTTSSGTAKYYVARVFSQWCSKESPKQVFQPAFPPGTDVSHLKSDLQNDYFLNYNTTSKTNQIKLQEFSTYDSSYAETLKEKFPTINYFDDWQDYTAGTNIEIPVWKSYFNNDDTLLKSGAELTQPPIALCFMDNCGNISFFNIGELNYTEEKTYIYKFKIK